MLDLLITGGTVVDGTGTPGRRADVGIRDGRIVALAPPGEIDEGAARTIDATDMVVAPGVVDIHTHYDAQLFWDPTASPSPLHGVTTIVAGNCGFTIAPLDPTHADYMARMLARVEGMPLESLKAGVPWDWKTFGEYLDRLEGRTAVNAGFLVGHSAIRKFVMGDRAREPASDADLDRMARVLHESLEAGGLGFSSSQAATHNDGEGQPVPSRFASRDELVALAKVVGEHPGTTLEFIPVVGQFTEEHMELMAAMSAAANRPLNWNLLAVTAGNEDAYRHQLSASDYAAARGGRVVALTVPDPVQTRLSFHTGFILDAVPGWADFFKMSVTDRIATLSDPVQRRRLNESAQTGDSPLRFLTRWEAIRIGETFTPELRRYQGRLVGEIAAEEGKEPWDALCDILVADELRTGLYPPLFGDDPESWQRRVEVWRDPRALIGASDAGAHLDLLATFVYSSSVLGPSVRDRRLLPLEEAVHYLTDAPARLYGLRNRGRLAVGWHADVIVFDPERLAPRPTYPRFDLPAGAWRLYAEADGMAHVLVNGVEIACDGEFTGATPGTLLRSGRDTDTVTAR
jgi:N-acyl-D-aspartate/D-glutamate deacylase